MKIGDHVRVFSRFRERYRGLTDGRIVEDGTGLAVRVRFETAEGRARNPRWVDIRHLGVIKQ